MYAVDFEFDGRKLSDFGCVLTTFSGLKDGAVPSGADVVFSTAKASGSDFWDLYATSYDTPFTATFSVCKDPCVGNNATISSFTPREVSAIQRWLVRRNKYCKFKLLEDGYEDVYWRGYFTSQQYMLGSSIVGFELTFTADAPYGYLEDVTLHYTPSANTDFTIDSISDEEGYVYPDVVITLRAAGTLTLSNTRDEKIMSIKNCTSGEIITIDGSHQIITSSRAAHDLSLDFNFYFPRIFNTYEDTINIYRPSLACNIDVTYTPAIKAGF